MIQLEVLYGPLRKGVAYKVIEEGYDWFLTANNVYVSKDICYFIKPLSCK